MQPQRLDSSNHRADLRNIPVLGRTPGSAHAKAAGPGILGRLGGAGDLGKVHQLVGLDARLIRCRLRAVTTVLGAASGLDGQQSGQFDIACRPMHIVHGLCTAHQHHERQVKQRLNLGYRPGL